MEQGFIGTQKVAIGWDVGLVCSGYLLSVRVSDSASSAGCLPSAWQCESSRPSCVPLFHTIQISVQLLSRQCHPELHADWRVSGAVLGARKTMLAWTWLISASHLDKRMACPECLR